MALLPQKLRYSLFDKLSLITMRYVHAIPRRDATGLVAEVYEQITEDFFINGSLTSRSKVPNILAAIWAAGRETILVDDYIDRTTKEAIAATMSAINDCPYCGDMLISLVHAGDRPDDAKQILINQEEHIEDDVLRERLTWVKSVATPGSVPPDYMPFSQEELPEVIGSIMAMSDINRFSHVVMDGSPVNAPFGLQKVKQLALGMFGNELRPNHQLPLKPGRTLHLLPAAELPEDLYWAKSNPRIAQVIAQWAHAVEEEASGLVSEKVQQLVHSSLANWQGEVMPISRSWVDDEIIELEGDDYAIARFALLLAKASYQIDDKVIEAVLGEDINEERFIRILAWCSFTSSRYIARRIVSLVDQNAVLNKQVA